jgi:hypothetical protein
MAGFLRLFGPVRPSHLVSVRSHQISVQSQLEMVVVATESQLSHFSHYFFSLVTGEIPQDGEPRMAPITRKGDGLLFTTEAQRHRVKMSKIGHSFGQSPMSMDRLSAIFCGETIFCGAEGHLLTLLASQLSKNRQATFMSKTT